MCNTAATHFIILGASAVDYKHFLLYPQKLEQKLCFLEICVIFSKYYFKFHNNDQLKSLETFSRNFLQGF